MKQESNSTDVDLFISYASRDRERVLEIAGRLESAGVRLWIDRHRIEGGTNYGPAIVRGIKGCKVFMLICSNASLRSRNVKQEIQLAWKYERPYLPQAGSRYDSFLLTGNPGREHLLAIIADEPPGLDWMPTDPKIPAHVLPPADMNLLLARLSELEGNRWMALSTYFDVIA